VKLRAWSTALITAASLALGVVAHAKLEADEGGPLAELAAQATAQAAPEATPDPAAALISDSDQRVGQLTAELQAGQQELTQLRERLVLRGKAYVRLIRLGMLPLSAGFDGLVGHANQVEGLRRGLARDVERQHALVQRAEQLRAQVRAAEEQRGRLRNELGDFELSREAILAARERELAFHRAFGGAAPRAADEHSTVYGSVGTPTSQAATFSELKGRLPFPVEGRAEIREVSDPDTGPGVELRVDLGGTARAVYRGKVVLVSEYADMGQAVVIDHGGGYSTVLGSLRQVSVEIGAEVRAGQAVGELAEVKGRGRLYFEVRYQNERLYPAEWLGL
jgi:murein hydrolase activator